MAFSQISATLNPNLSTQIDIRSLLNELEAQFNVKPKFVKGGKYKIECDYETFKHCEQLIEKFIQEAEVSENEDEPDSHSDVSGNFRENSNHPPLYNGFTQGQMYSYPGQYDTYGNAYGYHNGHEAGYGTFPYTPNRNEEATQSPRTLPSQKSSQSSTSDSMPPLETVPREELERLQQGYEDFGNASGHPHEHTERHKEAETNNTEPFEQSDDADNPKAYGLSQPDIVADESEVHADEREAMSTKEVAKTLAPPQQQQSIGKELGDKTASTEADDGLVFQRSRSMERQDTTPLHRLSLNNKRDSPATTSGTAIRHFTNDDEDDIFDTPMASGGTKAKQTKKTRPTRTMSDLNHFEEMYVEGDTWHYVHEVYASDLGTIEEDYGVICDTQEMKEEDVEFQLVNVRARNRDCAQAGAQAVQMLYNKIAEECYRNMYSVPPEIPRSTFERALRDLKRQYQNLVIKRSSDESRLSIIGEIETTKRALGDLKRILKIQVPFARENSREAGVFRGQPRPRKPAPERPETIQLQPKTNDEFPARHKPNAEQFLHSSDDDWKPPKEAKVAKVSTPWKTTEMRNILKDETPRETDESNGFRVTASDAKSLVKEKPNDEETKKGILKRASVRDDWAPKINFSKPQTLTRQDSDPFSEDAITSERQIGQTQGSSKVGGGQQVEPGLDMAAGGDPDSMPPLESDEEDQVSFSPYRMSQKESPLPTPRKRPGNVSSGNAKFENKQEAKTASDEQYTSITTLKQKHSVEGDKPETPTLPDIVGSTTETKAPTTGTSVAGLSTDAVEEDELQKAINLSLKEAAKSPEPTEHRFEFDLPGEEEDTTREALNDDVDDDLDFERAVQASLRQYEEEQRKSMSTFPLTHGGATNRTASDDVPALATSSTASRISVSTPKAVKSAPKKEKHTVLTLDGFDSDEEYARSLKQSYKEKKKRHGTHSPEVRHHEKPLILKPDGNEAKEEYDISTSASNKPTLEKELTDINPLTGPLKEDRAKGIEGIRLEERNEHKKAISANDTNKTADGSNLSVDDDHEVSIYTSVFEEPQSNIHQTNKQDKEEDTDPTHNIPIDSQVHSIHLIEKTVLSDEANEEGALDEKLTMNPNPQNTSPRVSITHAAPPVRSFSNEIWEREIEQQSLSSDDMKKASTYDFDLGTSDVEINKTSMDYGFKFSGLTGNEDGNSGSNPEMLRPMRSNSTQSNKSEEDLYSDTSLLQAQNGAGVEPEVTEPVLKPTNNTSPEVIWPTECQLMSQANDAFDYNEHIRIMPQLKSQSYEMQMLYQLIDATETSPDTETMIDKILNGSPNADPLLEFENMVSLSTSCDRGQRADKSSIGESSMRGTDTAGSSPEKEGARNEKHDILTKDNEESVAISEPVRKQSNDIDPERNDNPSLNSLNGDNENTFPKLAASESLPITVNSGKDATQRKGTDSKDNALTNEIGGGFGTWHNEKMDLRTSENDASQIIIKPEPATTAPYSCNLTDFDRNSKTDPNRTADKTKGEVSSATSGKKRKIVVPDLPATIFQPVGGDIQHRVDVKYKLPGFESGGTIMYTFDFPSGRMKAEGPFPGEPYQGTYYKTFLPINDEGNEVGDLMKEAFEERKLFTIAKSDDIYQTNIMVPSVPLITDRRKFPNDTYLEVVRLSLLKVLNRPEPERVDES